MLRRLRAGKSPFTADRKHLHHRLLDMGHSHFHAVLIFYGWTAVVSVGCLLFLFVQAVWAITFIAVGFIVCAWFTIAPLTRRKVSEAAVQLAAPRDAEDAGAARFDPLDQAANAAPAGAHGNGESSEAKDAAIDVLTAGKCPGQATRSGRATADERNLDVNNSSANRAKAAVPNPTAASVYSKDLRCGVASPSESRSSARWWATSLRACPASTVRSWEQDWPWYSSASPQLSIIFAVR